MRLCAAVAFAALLTVPAVAANDIADQAQAAYQLFAGGQSEAEFMSAGYGKTALANIAGNWVGLSGPAPRTGVETYGADTERLCKSPGVLTLASPDNFTLTLTARPVAVEFSQSYTLVAGATFLEYTEPGPYFAAIGLGPDKIGPQFDQSRALALSFANGIVQIFRPSADILVIHRDKTYPTVLARCPKP